jgi:hypothetical protein
MYWGDMPIIDVEFDDAKVTDEEIQTLSVAVQKIVSEVTGIEDVSVYANSARITVKVAPIEVFVRLSAHKIPDLEKMFTVLKTQVANWKRASQFAQSINLTLIPMTWKFEVGI